MSTDNENMVESITTFSANLTPDQLEQFLTIIDSLNDLLVMANQDTEHAYQLYLNSVRQFKDEPAKGSKLVPKTTFSNSNNNVVQFKH
ncbi:MAG: hypothetical protein HRT37_04735 [Alteromonadaceae bacterium]|nr:hypothetical protein [Alteromonadaceae bacterium]